MDVYPQGRDSKNEPHPSPQGLEFSEIKQLQCDGDLGRAKEGLGKPSRECDPKAVLRLSCRVVVRMGWQQHFSKCAELRTVTCGQRPTSSSLRTEAGCMGRVVYRIL